MDAVISYVNGCEKIWRTTYGKCVCNIDYTKYYDWGTLKYVLRGISAYMPYIKNVFLIVSNIEQVPDYVNQNNVHIVLHSEFIPEKYLPTFNSCTIELFMHRIPNLSNEFIYFNDDMIPINPISYNDLIYNGLPCMSFIENYSSNRIMSYYNIKKSFRAACLYVGEKNTYSTNIIENPLIYDGDGVCSVHGPCVFLRNKNEEIFNNMENYFDRTITITRNPKNVSQFIFSDVTYLENEYIGSRLSLSYMSTNNFKKDTCESEILSKNTNFICINDFGAIAGLTYKESADILQNILNKKINKVSKYEYDYK